MCIHFVYAVISATLWAVMYTEKRLCALLLKIDTTHFVIGKWKRVGGGAGRLKLTLAGCLAIDRRDWG